MSDAVPTLPPEHTYWPFAVEFDFASHKATPDITTYDAQSSMAWTRMLTEEQKNLLVNTAISKARSVQETQGVSEFNLQYKFQLWNSSMEIAPWEVVRTASLPTEVLPTEVLSTEVLRTTDWNLTYGGLVDGGLTVSTENRHRRTHHSHRHSSGRRRRTQHSSRHLSRARRRQSPAPLCTIF